MVFNNTLSITGHDAAMGIRGLDLEALQAAAAVQPTENDTIDRLLMIYSGVRGLLAILRHNPLLPPNWRRALQIFIESLDTLATVRGFKAGKDL